MEPEVQPAWGADMDFPIPDPGLRAIQQVVDENDLEAACLGEGTPGGAPGKGGWA